MYQCIEMPAFQIGMAPAFKAQNIQRSFIDDNNFAVPAETGKVSGARDQPRGNGKFRR